MITKSRKKFIEDVINTYIKNHPGEYREVLKSIKTKRTVMSDADLGKFADDKTSRAKYRFPSGLFNALDLSLDNPRFLEEKEEDAWFAKKFNQFMIPYGD